MKTENFNNSKNIFVCHPAGCGGNHIANLLSTLPSIEPRHNTKNYLNYLIEEYHTRFNKYSFELGFPVAHIGDLFNLSTAEDDFKSNEENILNSTKKYIFCTLPDEYATCTSSFENHFVNDVRIDKRIFFFLSFPKVDTMAYKRFMLGPWQNGFEFNKGMYYNINRDGVHFNYEDLYDVEKFKLICNDFQNKYHGVMRPITDDHILQFDTDQFYTMDGVDYLNSVLSTIGVELPEMCKYLHKMYMNVNYEYLKILEGK